MIQPLIPQMLQAQLHAGENTEPVIWHIFIFFSHETAAWKATNWVFSFKIPCLWQVFCSPSLCLLFLPSCSACHPFSPASTAAVLRAGLGNGSSLKPTEPKHIFGGQSIAFPDCFHPSLLSHSFAALDCDTGRGKGQGLGGNCLSWCCCKRKCIKKPQSEVQGL